MSVPSTTSSPSESQPVMNNNPGLLKKADWSARGLPITGGTSKRPKINGTGAYLLSATLAVVLPESATYSPRALATQIALLR